MVGAALVLSGGGPLAVGWELGVLRGLRDRGVPAGSFERVIGTSAGAIVGALLTADAPLEPIRIQAEAADTGTPSPPMGPPMGPRMGPQIGQQLGRLFADGGIPDQERRARLGRMALETATPERAYLDLRRPIVPAGPWPGPLVITAVDASDGSFVSWDAGDGVPLVQAVAASTALPGVHPPVTINGRRFVDGGVRSALSADLAAGSRLVVIVAALPGVDLPPLIAEEIRRVEATGGVIVQIRPDAQAEGAIGPNRMDETRQPLVFEAGVRQGTGAANEVSARLDRLS